MSFEWQEGIRYAMMIKNNVKQQISIETKYISQNIKILWHKLKNTGYVIIIKDSKYILIKS